MRYYLQEVCMKNSIITNTFISGDCTEVMSSFPDCSVNLVLTSPPYADQRDYGITNTKIKQNKISFWKFSMWVRNQENLFCFCEWEYFQKRVSKNLSRGFIEHLKFILSQSSKDLERLLSSESLNNFFTSHPKMCPMFSLFLLLQKVFNTHIVGVK